MTTKRTVYLSEGGDDENDRLTAQTAVLTGDRAVKKIALRKKTQEFDVSGSDAYIRIMNVELEKKRRRLRAQLSLASRPCVL
jgi:hypothetical protein